jgi:hypothetical protein
VQDDWWDDMGVTLVSLAHERSVTYQSRGAYGALEIPPSPGSRYGDTAENGSDGDDPSFGAYGDGSSGGYGTYGLSPFPAPKAPPPPLPPHPPPAPPPRTLRTTHQLLKVSLSGVHGARFQL